ncbi:hypothetical protein M0R45_007192 [Rubus argutus]|uniref:Uncharacterized protein n=1 Tax=Rubus argutus TaxID=59490 RepID=A0AAW1YUP5_RUBAR
MGFKQAYTGPRRSNKGRAEGKSCQEQEKQASVIGHEDQKRPQGPYEEASASGAAPEWRTSGSRRKVGESHQGHQGQAKNSKRNKFKVTDEPMICNCESVGRLVRKKLLGPKGGHVMELRGAMKIGR